jgi:hypothetical protein
VQQVSDRVIADQLVQQAADVAVVDIWEEPLMDCDQIPTHGRLAEMGQTSCFIEMDVSDEVE